MAKVIAIFFHDAVENGPKSTEAGRPIYDEVECIRLIVPGSRDEIVRRVIDEDKSIYAAEYARFKAQGATSASGTRLSEWPAMSVALIRELDHYNIRSIEDLADLSDTHIPNLPMGIREMRAKAQAHLARAADNAIAEKLGAQNAEQAAKIADLEAKIAALQTAAEAGKKGKAA